MEHVLPCRLAISARFLRRVLSLDPCCNTFFDERKIGFDIWRGDDVEHLA